MSDTPSFKVTPVTLGVVATCIGLFLSGWNGVSYFKNLEFKNAEQDMRLDRTDRDRARNIESINKLTDKTGELKEAVVRLTTVIETGGLTKKAERQDNSLALPADFTIQTK